MSIPYPYPSQPTPSEQTFKYLYERRYYVADYAQGPVFNGVHDDTSAIQAALNDAAVTGGVVVMPAGQGIISASILMLNPSIALVGQGVDSTFITLTTTNIDGIIVGNSQHPPFTQLNNIGLTGFTLSLPSGSTGRAINITGSSTGSFITNVKTNNGSVGFLLEDANTSIFTNIQAFSYTNAGIVCRQGQNNSSGSFCFINCACFSNATNTVCMQFDADTGQPSPNKFDRVTIINGKFFCTPGLTATTGVLFTVGCVATIFLNSHWENTIQHVVVTAECDMGFQACSYINTNFGSTPTTDVYYLNSFAQVDIQNCVYQTANNIFNGVSGFPRVSINAQNKNNGNITNIFTGSFAKKIGTDTEFAGSGALTDGLSGSPYGTVFAQKFVGGSVAGPVTTKTGAYTASTADGLILGNATGGAFTITLPNATAQTGLRLIVKKTDASANVVTVATGGGNIDGAATKALSTQFASIDVISDGTNWWIV